MKKTIEKSIKKKASHRPLKYDNVGIVEDKISKYFNKCDVEKVPYTISELALALDVTRETLNEWEHNKVKGFSDSIKKAKLKVIAFAEKKLYSNNVTGAIYHLKCLDRNNWTEKQDIHSINEHKIEEVEFVD